MQKALRILAATVLALAVVGALVWFGNVQQVASEIDHFQRIYLLWFVLLMLAHEVVRTVLWAFLLRSLRLRVPLSAQVFSFAAGEVAKFVPTGAYLQNYLLQRSDDVDFGVSSAATTAIIVAEIAIALLGVVLIGPGAWTSWLRPVVGVGALVTAGLIWVVLRFHPVHRKIPVPRYVREHRLLRTTLDEVRRFRKGTAALLHPRIIAYTVALSAAYVVGAGVALYLVVLGLHIGGVSLWQALGVYFFGLAFYVVLGSLEAADVGMFLVIGVSKTAAVSAVLINRALGVGITTAAAMVVMVVLHDELGVVLRGRRTTREEAPEAPEPQPLHPTR